MSKTKIIKIDPASPEEKDIEFAAELLRDGGLVAFPTETVYGIGANYLNEKAVNKLYEVKKRPRSKPFTIHISDMETIENMHCKITPLAKHLMKKFWPGPLTLILESKDSGKLGFRMPDNNIAKALISKSGVPVVAPSANLSGDKPPAEAAQILEKLDGQIDLILDGGKAELGKESTVIDTANFSYRTLRKGAIPESDIAAALQKLS